MGVAAVQFLVDGAVLAEDTTAPDETVWDTRTAPDGTHTLTARARDAAGNTAPRTPVMRLRCYGTSKTAGHEPPKSPEVDGLGLWSWMLPPPGPGPPNVWSESPSVVYTMT